MKTFLVVLCSLTLASCASLDGYQYKQNQGFIGNSIGDNHHQHQQGFIGAPVQSLGNTAQQGLLGAALPGPLHPQSSYGAPHSEHRLSFGSGLVLNAAPVITKDVYIHVAPEEPEEHISPQNLQQQAPRKHYRIIFIKAPSQSNRGALKLLQAQPQIEEKTVIYVLSKKTDAADIQAALQQAPQPVQHKPEVFFIKYKTQQEALHAQQQIQAQYDALGGTSQVLDEGVAPVSSVIGALGNHASTGPSNLGGSHGGGNIGGGSGLISGIAPSGPGGIISQPSGSSSYLPPHRH